MVSPDRSPQSMKRTAMALPLHQMLSVDRSDAQAMKAKSKTLANLQRGKIPLLQVTRTVRRAARPKPRREHYLHR